MRWSLSAGVPTYFNASAAIAKQFAGDRLVRHGVPRQQHLQPGAARRRAQQSDDEGPIAQVVHGDVDPGAAACPDDGIEQCGLDSPLGEKSSVDRAHTATLHLRTYRQA